MKTLLVLFAIGLVLLAGCTGTASKDTTKTTPPSDTTIKVSDSDFGTNPPADENQLDDLSLPKEPDVDGSLDTIQESDLLVEEQSDEQALDDLEIPSEPV